MNREEGTAMNFDEANYRFWKLAYEQKWCTIEQLRMAVKTEAQPFGEISPEHFKAITGNEF